MLLVRIKCPDRNEKKKVLVSSKREFFTWQGTEYLINPRRCYRTSVFLGLKDMYALDYVKGSPQPVDYWSVTESGRPGYDRESNVTVDAVTAVMLKLRNILRADWQLYLSLGCLVVGIITLVMVGVLMESVG